MSDPFTPPAIVRPAEDLEALAAEINAEHEAGEDATCRGLEHFRRAGEKLLKAKEQCGHGNWLSWLKRNVKFSERQARRYMALAKSEPGSDLETQWRALYGRGADEPVSSVAVVTEDPPQDFAGMGSLAKSAVTADLKPAVTACLEGQEEQPPYFAGTGGPAETDVTSGLICDVTSHSEGQEEQLPDGKDGYPPLPPLAPGRMCFCMGESDDYRQAAAVIEPHPDHPGYWSIATYHEQGNDVGDLVIYIGGGIALDRLDRRSFAALLSHLEFAPTSPWYSFPAKDRTPDPVRWHRQYRLRAQRAKKHHRQAGGVG
jgi:hypothetical protein